MNKGNFSKEVAIAAGQKMKEREYWLNQLAGDLVKSSFPRVRRKAVSEQPLTHSKDFSIPADITRKLIELGNGSDFRLHIILTAGLMLLMEKYTGNEDIVIGAPIYKQEIEGELVNTILALRNRINKNKTFKEFLLEVAKTIFDANENQNYPMETLLYKLNLSISAGDFPLFDAALLLENIHDKNYLSQVKLNTIFRLKRTDQYIAGQLDYNTALYDESFIQGIINHFINLLQQCTGDINVKLSDLDILSLPEKKKLIHDFNNNKTGDSRDKTLCRIIEDWAEKEPARISVIFEEKHLTYRELNENANRLAVVLKNSGVGEDYTVGILMERTPLLIESILAVWKAGGAYIPMETDYPGRRILEIMNDSGTGVLISRKEHIDADLANAYGGKILLIPGEINQPGQTPGNNTDENSCRAKNPGWHINMGSLAYVIYTSGSTGKPKGAMVEHAGMMNHMQAKITQLSLTGESIAAQNASYTFDISVWQFFAALNTGGRTVIYSHELILEPEQFIARLIKDRVTILELVPSYLTVMLDSPAISGTVAVPLYLHYLLVTGEEITPQLVNKWLACFPGIPMVNAYGPTEASDDITHFIIDKHLEMDRVPIGKPLQNLNIYIVDDNMSLCPVGVKGEILVSGVGVGRGYLKDKERTAGAFMEDPFREEKGVRLYKTGDLGRWLPDGTIEFFGRKDYQVKIRGYRIEPGEIESRLKDFEGIKEAVVIDRTDESGNKYLCAYIVAWGKLKIPAVKNYLLQVLPDYMTPSYFMELEKIPLTPNGKVDRNALPGISAESMTTIPYIDAAMLEQLVIPVENVGKKPLTLGSDLDGEVEYELSGEERDKLLHTFNDTNVEYPPAKTLVDLFGEQVEKTPDNIALVGMTYDQWLKTQDAEHQGAGSSVPNSLSYRVLDEKSNQLAHYLLRRGTRPNDSVALKLERTLEMIISMLAVLKTGCVYVPLNPKAPDAMNRFILQECRVKILLTPLELAEMDLDHLPTGKPGIEIKPTAFAYTMFTSGSTGTPKGVSITHANLFSLLHWGYKKLDIDAQQRTVQNLAYYFDWSVWEIFITLTTGAVLVMVTEEILQNPRKTITFLIENAITVFHVTPTQYSSITGVGEDKLVDLKYLFLGAEKLTVELLEKSLRTVGQNCRVFNMYGPTECTIINAVFEINRAVDLRQAYGNLSSIPIGSPAGNTALLILDPYSRLCPINTVGQLYIGGDSVACGYLNNPELTAEKFRPLITQMAQIENKSFFRGSRGAVFSKKAPLIYKTGDLARWLADGNIEFLGRTDYQVKLSGIRIEPGDIESQLMAHNDIETAVVIARENEKKEIYFCAYLVSPKRLTASELAGYLYEKIPFYMVPSYFIQLEKIPLTPNGKVNRRLIERIEIKKDETQGFRPPVNEVEEKLAGVWAEVLGIPKDSISTVANFFDLGGHSLKAINMIAKIHKVLDIKLPLSEVFKNPRIKGLAEYIAGLAKDKYTAITPVEKKEYYELSSAQKRLYFLQQMTPESTAYNMPMIIPSWEEEDIEKLVGAFGKLINRHESLRTSFHMIANEPVQRVHDRVEFTIGRCDSINVQPGVSKDNQDYSSQLLQFTKPFDLSQAPLLRASTVQTGEGKLLLLVDMHHIISDAASHDVLAKDFMALYRGETLTPLSLHYKDYSGWQNSQKQKEAIQKQELYWLNEFKRHDELPVLQLPDDYPRPLIQDFEGSSVNFSVNEQETQTLMKLQGETGTTLYMVILSVWSLLLSKLSGQEDIITGTPVAGRRHSDLEHIIGMFVNTLPIRTFPVGGKTFKEFLNEVKKCTLDAFENQDYPFEDLVDKISPHRDISRNPIFDVMYNLLTADDSQEKIAGVEEADSTGFKHIPGTSKFDITLTSSQQGKRIFNNIRYSTKLFKPTTIERIISYFKNILFSLSSNAGTEIADVEIISREEKKRLLNEFNNTGTAYPQEKTIYELFVEQAGKTPDYIAVIGPGGMSITYEELNRKSNQLALLLREKGVEPDMVVGIMAERSVEMVVGLMGILKSGGAYMPINPEYPQERIDYMLKDSNAKVLIINKSEIRNPKLETNPNNQNLNDQNKKRNSGAALVLNFENLNFEFVSNFVLRASNLFSSNLAYIIYTSGSTGKPKGVMIAHNALMNRLNWMQRNYPIGQGDVILQKTTFTFDVSVWELFWWSMSGAALCLLEPGGEKDPGQITLTIERNHISTMHFVPSMLSIFLDYVQANNQAKKLSTLKWVFTSGEALLPVHVERFNELLPRENDVALANLYGPTEATIDVSYFNCLEKKEREVIPIGKPIDNINLYILDKNFHHQPIGMIGELYILGTGLARGYLNRSELTAEKFINFHHLSFLLNGRLRWGLHHSKLYRTGDLARWLPDGNIEFMGRIDLQVKIRGFRIELGEIENQLLKHKCIKEAVVVINVNTMKDKNLTAYVISTDKLLEIELREYLQQKLPDYMIPSHFVQLEKIPLTPNGKLDRKALPKPELKVSESYIAPKDEIEKKMAVIWSEVLDQTVIGVDDNFFHLGGHSLKATILVSKIHKVFQVNVPLAEIFKTPTIRNLSNYIKVADKDRYVSISPVEKKEYYTLSSAQKRLYILYQMDPQGIGYNIPSLLALEGEIDKEKLEQTFRQLIHRHESLRTSFYMINDVPVQRIHEELEFEIEYLAAKNTNEREDGRGAPPWSPFIRPFELSNAPLLRVGLVKEKGDRQILMVDMHHIISDGTSMNILVNDFMAMYQGENLSGLQVQYKDFSNWQNSEKQVESLKLQGEYWLNEFASEIPALELPVDYPRPAVQSFEGSNIHFEIDKETTVVLKNLALETDVTIYMVLLSLYTVFLAKLTNQEDIIIGSPIAGRRHADLEKIIGMFVNTLALRNFPSGEKRFMDFLREVKEKTLNAFENQDYPYEKLVNQVVINREISRNPLFDVIFLLQNMDIAGINIPGLKLTPYPYENKTAKSDLRLTGIEEENKLLFTFEYCTKLFKKETVERFIVYFKNIVKSIVADTKRKISDFEILTVEEKKQILFDFNDTEAEYPKDKTIHQLFVEQALESPDHIAIVGESIVETPCAASVQYQFQITYHELNNQSNRLAGLLIEKGVLPDTIVGIMIERSIEMIIGIFGILKSGGAYLPIDPMYPQERIDHMLKDSAAKFLAVANNKEGEKVRRWEGEKMLLESIFHPANHLFYQHSALELPRILHSNHLCYIIYTSGSTGRPKGVMVDHHSVVNYIKWAIKNYIKNEENVSIPLFTPLSFDLTVTSVFTPLLSGNSILAYKETFIDKIIEDNRVEVIKLTPSHLKIILEISQKLKSNIKRFIVGGESLETKLAENITGKFNKSLEIYNEYGPTEATVGCMIYRFSNDYGMLTAVPIGTPAANVQIYILDKNRKPVPVGVPGEIYIGGECVARGYLNCPELTAEKFIKNNRSNRTNIFYKTGDLAKFLDNGNIEFLGRIDQQVKIRGFRIELEEIQKKLMEYKKHKPITADHLESLVSEVVNIRRCSKCLLPANYPDIHFDNNGTCNICLEYDTYKDKAEKYFKSSNDFYPTIEKIIKEKRGEYDCLLLFSGGKDSTYVLYKLIDMGLKVLTFTFDNGYISDAAFANIKHITSNLGIENIVCRAKNMNRIFVESLHTNHNACHGCWNVLNTMGIKIAHEKDINLVISGLSRGQIVEMRLEGLFQLGIFDELEIDKNLLMFRKSFHSKSNIFSRILEVELAEDPVENIHFVDFFRYFDTPVAEINEYLINQGWRRPENTGFCSSNCIINDVGIYVHLKEKGYHFYAAPLSWDCRLGVISREQGLRETGFEDAIDFKDQILKEIGYYDPPIKDAVLIDNEDSKGDKYLCAYIVSDEELSIQELRKYLSDRLPEYMIPSYFVNMEKIPLTTNGKVDRKMLPKPELKIGESYKAPQDEIEKILVEIWAKILGRDKIGINQNFFTIGGDSIKSIQIISRMSRAGYKMEMKDLFQYPEISKLAPRIKKIKRIPDQSVISGTIPLTPIQKAFFYESHREPHHYNQAVMLYSREGFDKDALKKVFTRIQEHHDALRMTYKEEKGKIIQFNQGLDIPLDLRVIDLRSENDADVLEKKVNEIQSGINLSAGPLMKLGLFHMNDGDRLLVVIHHLVVDGISWRILLEDIDILFGQYNRGEEMILPAKTDSFNIWAEKLLGYANSDTFLKKSSYWAKLETNIITGIKKDFETEDNCVKDTQRISFTLGEEETNLLLSKVNNAFKTEINDILLTALGLGVKKAFGQDRVLIAMEGHGREEIIENIDISRTVGWFTSLYPVLLDVSYADDPGRQVKEIKETLRKIPEKGTGYGILKYLTGEEHKKEMDFKLKPQISFNYLGQIDTDVQQISFLKIAGESTGNMQSLTNQRKFEVEINGITSNKMLSMTLSYNEKHFKTVTMETFMNHFQSELRHMITFCCAKENMEFTPSDFTYKGLSIENVDRLMELYPGMEDIYTLTPLQEGILFHSLYDDSSYSYFVQVSYRLQGDLDIYLVEKSLNELFKRHDILRTAFFYKNLEQHVQVVLKDRTVGFYYEDISITRDKKEKEALIESFKTKDKDRMFDLSKDALMRVSILRVDKSEYEFTWSFHHILMDGWCSGILITEFLEIYTGYLENRPYRLPSIKQFRSYIQWLDKQDKEASAAYWKNYLDDFEQQTPLLKKTTIKKGYRSETVSFVINKEETTRLNELSAAHHVTLNTLIQATWGILLGKYNGKNDVVFGAVVSGRPFELEGVESIVGLFINAIPIRVRFEGKMKFFQLLKKIQTGAIEAEKHHHCPLVDIQSGSLLKRNLFDHIMAFENYPLTERIEGYGSEGKASNKPHFELTNVDIFEQSNYDFNVAVSVSETININFLYNGHAYERNLIERIGSHLSLIMDQVIGNYQIEIEEIELLSSQEKQNILEDFKNEYVEYPKDKNISEEENEEYSGDFGFN